MGRPHSKLKYRGMDSLVETIMSSSRTPCHIRGNDFRWEILIATSNMWFYLPSVASLWSAACARAEKNSSIYG
jgi:hypothetical protein